MWNLREVDHVRLMALGKASLPMVRAALPIVKPDEALVVTHVDETLDAPELTLIQASHPVPDEECMRAGKAALAMARQSEPGDLIVVLLSGGGSSMVEHSDLPLKVIQETNRLLLRTGMDIEAVNTVRKHLSSVKGGHLGKVVAQRGAELLTLAISDVVGDDPSLVASGPTVPDPSTFQDARDVLERVGTWEAVPEEVRERIRGGIRGTIEETPKPDDPDLARSQYRIVASLSVAAEAAAAEAGARGYVAHTFGTQVQGKARKVGPRLLSVALSIHEDGRPVEPPAVIVAGGETTVRVRGRGTGGRNQELVLSAVRGLSGKTVVMLSFDTDGRDGETEAGGAIADGESLGRSRELGMDPDAFLAESDSHRFFTRLGDTILTGPTGTNVMDLQLLLVGPPP